MAGGVREYFRELDEIFNRGLTPVVKWLFYCSIVAFILSLIAPIWTTYYFGASASRAIYRGWVWQLFTYALLHQNFSHLLFNLIPVYFFGVRLEQRWGMATFLRFVVIVAAGAVLTHLLVTIILMKPGLTIIGMSGVVYGILFAYAYYYPNDVVLLYFVLPIKVKHLVAILGVLTFLASTPLGGDGNVAHLTHLGGLLFGFLYVRFPRFFDWIQLPRLRRKPRAGRKRGPQQYMGDGRWE
ncbi:MAG: rhomboid family intramembrane serine protease [Candidatus Sumerlaeaceae bacterium]|nr:rhomboid family intramembrane serine protease [Candidatus Sumerlaeaceae bacterium]